MNFELNDEQRALQESLRRLLAKQYTFEKRRVYAESTTGHDEHTWEKFAELGLTALLVPEAFGGFGGGARDLLPVMQELGAALSLEPLLASNVLAAAALRLTADNATCAEVLPQVATGKRRLAWAHNERAGRHSALWIESTATNTGKQWRINGNKASVIGAIFADQLIVSARIRGAPDEEVGCALFLVDANGEGVDSRHYRLVDDTSATDISLQYAEAVPLTDPMDCKRADSAIEGTQALGIAAVCAEMVGASQAALTLTIEYLNTRKQFGRVIGENQALRHRAAEMLVSLELAKSMAIAAAVAVDDPADESAKLDLHRAKYSVARHARAVAHGAIQLHGGIGMTEEYAVGHYLRRIHVLDQLFGDGDTHTAKLASLAHA
ncbi:acyl-CoA dehydrogenase family protein [Cupriavidus consociatus]|uniref:acyl-CoA dehydrogenase family protein n=1 Tax=Cupriavidus consociatus TaxID=2821357 RepID=UPI001AE6A6FC|nr:MULTISPECIES: acyl-CoA dehydrogenase family protein [unclassified Cupriavidus]MBP0623774.1 acyl-CoA dehydrogenase family protein [Cupriavidus sp. LEh25]MDK2660480.1 acyl-CoA dehydrogenase family protein [Cupriavidus sp. LEh21]